VVERVTPGTLELPAETTAFVQLDRVELSFNARPRDDSVTV
jgi:hypothetical protein